jgi:hypothetical protein
MSRLNKNGGYPNSFFVVLIIVMGLIFSPSMIIASHYSENVPLWVLAIWAISAIIAVWLSPKISRKIVLWTQRK